MLLELLIKILIDVSLTSTMLVLAYLSRKMGEALKIPPYYVFFYSAAVLIVAAGCIDTGTQAVSVSVSPVITNIMRGCAGIAAFVVCLRYWGWLFSEFFGIENRSETNKKSQS